MDAGESALRVALVDLVSHRIRERHGLHAEIVQNLPVG